MAPGPSAAAVQTLVRATRVPGTTAPHDTAHVKAYYPATTEPCDAIGTLTPDASFGQLPVFVWLPGNSTDPALYSWLAEQVAAAGYCFVTAGFIGLIPPDVYGMTPGVDLSLARPETFGSAPMSTLLAPILAVLADVNATDGPLRGLLDLDSVVIGGHSAGGTVALNSARHAFFPQLRGVATYASHTMASTMFGWQPGTVLPLAGDVPVLLVAAGQDGLVAKGARWYGEDASPVEPIARTFATLSAGATRDASRLVTIDGANHFSICAPRGESLPRWRDDLPATVDEEAVRRLVGDLLLDFLAATLKTEAAAMTRLDSRLAASDLIAAHATTAEESA